MAALVGRRGKWRQVFRPRLLIERCGTTPSGYAWVGEIRSIGTSLGRGGFG